MVSTELVSIGILYTRWRSQHMMITALKKDDIAALKTTIGFDPNESFIVPQQTRDLYAKIAERGAIAQKKWEALLTAYGQKYPAEHKELTRRIRGDLPEGWEKKLPVLKVGDPAVASRKLSENVLTAIHDTLPELFGGSADLTGSNLTRVKNDVDFQPPSTGLGNYAGRYFRYGVREHAMGAIMNGLSAYGGIIPFGGTFLVRSRWLSYAESQADRPWPELRLLRRRSCEIVCSQWAPSHLGR